MLLCILIKNCTVGHLFGDFGETQRERKQELSHDSIARLNCVLPLTKIRAVA